MELLPAACRTFHPDVRVSARTNRTPRLPTRRRLLFAAVMLAVPFLFFAALEYGLRLGGYGTDLRLFTTETVGGRAYGVMNPDVAGRYFPRTAFTPTTSADLFTIPKDPGVFRVFVLGGSTTAGYPYGLIGSFSTFLRDRLQALFPDRVFEIVNLGLTATNSFTVLDIARELPRFEPDLLIVYDGHNEFYGALGMASRESFGRSRWLSRLYLSAVRLRTVQLLRSLLFSRGGEAPRGGTMMERLAAGQTIRAGDPLYRDVAAAFSANLGDLTALCRTEGIPLILSTQVSNLRHLPPFVSLHRPGLPAADSLRIAALLDSASSGRPGGPALLRLLQLAHGADSQHAGTAFRYASALDAAGETADALDRYRHARDMDALRFRTDEAFNAIIRGQAAPGVTVVDAESVLAAHSPDGIPGRELILEHLHPTARGYFLLGAAYAAAMRRMGLAAPQGEWRSRDTLDEEDLWNARPLTALDEAAGRRRTDILTAGWPFRAVAVTPSPPDPADRFGRIVEDLVRGRSTWEEAHVAASAFFLQTGDTAAAEREYLALINQLPRNVSAYILLGRLRAERGRLDEARSLLLRSLIHEETAGAFRLLGGIDLQRRENDSAAVFFERAFTLSGPVQERAENGYLLAVALGRAGNPARAREVLTTVLTFAPDYEPARSLLRRMEGAGQ